MAGPHNGATGFGGRQALLVDADDTLWANNIHFERAIAEFIAFLAHSTLAAAEVRAALDEIERVNIAVHGYGAAGFARNLCACYERLAEREIADDDLARVRALGEQILELPIALFAGVAETLRELAGRHDLVLVTKGHHEEQRRKIERSGIAAYFARTVIVPEKDVSVYERLVAELGSEPARTWMIGNSPKSDINPALAAGLNAVYVPCAETWRLEHEELHAAPGRLLVLDRFADLRLHF